MKKHLMKFCIVFYFFLFSDFQLYASLINLEESSPCKKELKNDWTSIVQLMNNIDKKENKKLLSKEDSKNFIHFFKSHYHSGSSQVVFDSFVKEYKIENIKNKIAKIILKLSKKYINQIDLKKYVSIMIGLGPQEIERLQKEQIEKLYISCFTTEQLSWFGEKIRYLNIASEKHSENIILYLKENYQENQDNSKLLWLLTKISPEKMSEIEEQWIKNLSREQVAVFNQNQ